MIIMITKVMLPAVATLPSSLWYLISLTAQHSVHISLPFLLFVQWVVNGSGPISKEPSFLINKTNVRWSKPMNVLLEYSLFSFNIVWEEARLDILICAPDDCVVLSFVETDQISFYALNWMIIIFRLIWSIFHSRLLHCCIMLRWSAYWL